MNQVKMAENPQYALNQILMSNPQIKTVLNLIKNAGDPKAAFLNYAKQLGVNPEEIIKALQE